MIVSKIEKITPPSKPEGFHLQLLTDSVREPLNSYGSCQPSLQISQFYSYKDYQGSSRFRLTLVIFGLTHPLRSNLITRISSLLQDDPPLIHASILSPFVFSLIRFSLSIMYKVPTFHRKARIKLVPPVRRMPPKSVSRLLLGLSQDSAETLILTSLSFFRRLQRFTYRSPS